ncbi:hypothetical protein CF326_g9555 [Tilletia indica]|nr:hypothetical protein CF326_g9555 [Tilletia indica]
MSSVPAKRQLSPIPEDTTNKFARVATGISLTEAVYAIILGIERERDEERSKRQGLNRLVNELQGKIADRDAEIKAWRLKAEAAAVESGLVTRLEEDLVAALAKVTKIQIKITDKLKATHDRDATTAKHIKNIADKAAKDLKAAVEKLEPPPPRS